MKLPTAKDISPQFGTDYEALDEIHAREMFLGKTLEEAEALFRKNALYYQESLVWMGPTGFHYYIRAFLSYLESSHAEGDSDALSSFLGLIESKRKEPGLLEPVSDLVLSTLAYVAEHHTRYSADVKIYGDLKKKAEGLCAALRRKAPNQSSQPTPLKRRG